MSTVKLPHGHMISFMEFEDFETSLSSDKSVSESDSSESEKPAVKTTTTAKFKGPLKYTFPQKLYEVVNDSSTDHIISWIGEEGNVVRLHDREAFCKELMPRCMNTDRFQTFNQ